VGLYGLADRPAAGALAAAAVAVSASIAGLAGAAALREPDALRAERVPASRPTLALAPESSPLLATAPQDGRNAVVAAAASPRPHSLARPHMPEELRAAAEDGALVGTTVDAEGRALSGVTVTFLDFGSEPLEQVRSDSEGAFRVDGLGRFQAVDATRDDYRMLHATNPEDDPLGPWAPMRVTLVPTGSLVVTVRTDAGRALAGVSVRARPRPDELVATDGGESTLPSSRAAVEAHTDADGRAVLAELWSGVRLDLELVREEEEHATAIRTDRQRAGELVLAGGDGTPIVCALGEVRELLAVWDDARRVRGRVLDARDQAAEDVRVHAVDEGRGSGDETRELGSAVSDADGRFELLLEGAATLGPVRLEAWRSKPEESASLVLELDELEYDEERVLRLAADEIEHLSGTLVDGCGRALARARHALVLIAPGARDFDVPGSVSVGDDESFFASALSTGALDLWVADRRPLLASAGGCPVFTRFAGLRTGSDELVLRGAAGAAVELTIRGEALALVSLARLLPADGARIAGATAARALVVSEPAFWLAAQGASGVETHARPDGVWIVASDRTGSARELSIALGEPGWYAIGVASEAPLAPVATERMWFDAGEHVLDVRPPQATGVLRGRLVADGARAFYGIQPADEHGRPFSIAAPGSDPAQLDVKPVKASGEFLLRELAVGRYRLRAGTLEELAAGRFTREVELDVVAGENPFIELEL
jgi:hypothetical protein